MNKDDIYMIFRAKMGDSALRVYRERQFLDKLNIEKFCSELNPIFSELQDQCKILAHNKNCTLDGNMIMGLLQRNISKGTLAQIETLLSLSEEEVCNILFVGFENFLRLFDVTVTIDEERYADYSKTYIIDYSIGSAFGAYCSSKQECKTLGFIERMAEIPVHGFFETFCLDEYIIKQIISHVIPLDILKHNRYFSTEESAETYLEGFKAANVDEVIGNLEGFLTPEGFFPIDSIFYVLSRQLIEKRNFTLWIDLIQKMECPVLQNELLFVLDDSCMCKRIVSYILEKVHGEEKPKVLLALLRKRWFQCLIDNSKNLIDALKLNRVSEEEKKLILDCSNEWKQSLAGKLNVYIGYMLKAFSASDFSKWSLKKKLLDSSRQTTQTEANNRVVNTLWDCLLQMVDWHHLDTSNGDYRFVLFCVSCYLKEEKNNAKQLNKYASEMEVAIEREDFSWNLSLDESTQSDIREWNKLIMMLNKEYPQHLLRKELVIWEGYNATPLDKIYKAQRRESFVMTTLALLLENNEYFSNQDEKKNFFMFLAQTILTQKHCCVFDRVSVPYYYLPLFILELVAKQVFNEMQEWYHNELLEKIDDFRTLLRLFTDAGSSFTEIERNILSQRKQKEWIMIRSCMEDLGQSKKDIAAYEEMMVKMGV